MTKLAYFSILLVVTTLFLLFFTAKRAFAACTITVTNTNNSGAGSLRQAILDANLASNIDEICFNISGTGVKTITPTSALPVITQPVIIDGTTQTGFSGVPLIEVDGSSAGIGAIGIRITGNGSGSTIKSLIINRFSSNGVLIDTDSVTVVGNYIGTNATGTAASSNGGDGIGIFSGTVIVDASNNIIGGTVAADRNLISGNGGNGVGITVQDGGTASSNVIQGNYIGTNASGTGSIANQGDGVLLNHVQGGGTLTGNTIGGSIGTTPDGACTGACNLISGNTANGIGLWHSGVSSNNVQGNFVGTNVSGNGSVANGNIGIELNEAPNNTVGGTSPAIRNIFSGNGGAGVFITGVAATGNVIQGNYIGTNSAGTSGVGNTKMGLSIGASPGAIGANNNIIGGTTGISLGGSCTGACNLISGNSQNGIFISGSESYGHIIKGNYIGTNVAGTSSIGNVLDGIGILNTPNLQIGGSTNNDRNIISGNGENGVIVVGNASTGNRIQNNYIGLNTSGNILGNTGSGIAVSSATDTAILGNNIAFNGLLGIDLDNNGSINLNDPNDSDIGANRLQNFPEVYAAETVGVTTKIGGQFNGTPNTSFQLDFFSNDGCNAGKPNNYGEGQTPIGTTSITTDLFGNTAFGFTPASPVPGGKYITATSTKKIGSIPAETSEFSQCILINVSRPALTNGATWFLKNDLITGPADKTFGYGFPSKFLMCSWDGNQPGVKLPVIYSFGVWYMRASYTTGTADLTFAYGGSGDQPVCGDWDGDGIETAGVVTSNFSWNLRNTNSSGPPDIASFQFGPIGSIPMVGDWDGDGDDTIGVVTNGNQWYLRNSNNSGSADAGTPNYGHTPGYPVVGDWDGDGDDTIGSINLGGTWSLRNSNNSGVPNLTFQYGFPGTKPLIWK